VYLFFHRGVGEPILDVDIRRLFEDDKSKNDHIDRNWNVVYKDLNSNAGGVCRGCCCLHCLS